MPGVDPNLPADQRVWVDAPAAHTSLHVVQHGGVRDNSPGVWGNVPKGYLSGPSFWNADLAFSRNINWRQGRRVEIRVEAFNLFDHVNWGNPNVHDRVDSLTNGRVTNTTGDPRIMQFALKYNF